MQWITMDYKKLRVIKDAVAVSSEFREKNSTFGGAAQMGQAVSDGHNVS